MFHHNYLKSRAQINLSLGIHMMNHHYVIQSFHDEMLSNGINPPNEIIANGKLQRFYIHGDKKGSKNGWYVLYTDKLPCGVFGSWKTGVKFSWCFKKKENMTVAEANAYQQQISEAKHLRDIEQVTNQKTAALVAEQRWDSYSSANPRHLYLMRKRINPFYARQRGQSLVLPIIDFSGEFYSLQYINKDGSKMFLFNGAITGHFIPVQGRPGDGRKILICEGFSTAATLAQNYPDYCVIAACNAGNLKPVAIKIRENLPSTEIVICADDDRLNKVNTGLIGARAAALASGALFTQPEWPEGAPKSLTDYNDLACWLYNLEVTK